MVEDSVMDGKAVGRARVGSTRLLKVCIKPHYNLVDLLSTLVTVEVYIIKQF